MLTEGRLHVRGVWHPLSDVTHLSVARGPSHPSAQTLSVTAICIAIIGLAAVIGMDDLLWRCAVGGASVCLVVALTGAAVHSWHTRPYELWVRCRGDWLHIYASRDAVEFGKVHRMVYRIIDQPRDASE
ncbi:DUF6232 family protein [Luedemannella helvata]|uniref:Uncharacterized protein n=1 Tax=Luedemannella helvata TaxID=349315 RepID=A0ABN2KXL1_9ACTN